MPLGPDIALFAARLFGVNFFLCQTTHGENLLRDMKQWLPEGCWRWMAEGFGDSLPSKFLPRSRVCSPKLPSAARNFDCATSSTTSPEQALGPLSPPGWQKG